MFRAKPRLKTGSLIYCKDRKFWYATVHGLKRGDTTSGRRCVPVGLEEACSKKKSFSNKRLQNELAGR